MSAINLSGNASGSGTFSIASPNSNTSYTLSLPEEAGTITTSNSPYSTFRNRIINGDMRIDQRNAGAAVTNVTSAYVLDRWAAAGSTDGAVTIQQSSTAPDGFSNSMQLTAATADASIGAAQYYQFFQKIEGYNIADLMLGTATAKTFTVSFWVRSSKTGTYCATLANSASNRLCPVNFTISSADTWEYKSFTVAGDTTGTWLTTNGIGLFLVVNLALGSNFNAGTSGTWNTTQYGTSSQVNWLDTINATFYITGVQLEVGSVATPFERLDYGRQLIQCQRYFFKLNSTYTGGGFNGSDISGNNALAYYKYPVDMRADPTVTQTGTISINSGATSTTKTSITSMDAKLSHMRMLWDITGAGFTSGYASHMDFQSGAQITVSAEL